MGGGGGGPFIKLMWRESIHLCESVMEGGWNSLSPAGWTSPPCDHSLCELPAGWLKQLQPGGSGWGAGGFTWYMSTK